MVAKKIFFVFINRTYIEKILNGHYNSLKGLNL